MIGVGIGGTADNRLAIFKRLYTYIWKALLLKTSHYTIAILVVEINQKHR